MPDKIVYLDAQATTPVDPAVLREMLPYFTEAFGNASSRAHAAGRAASAAVEKARTRCAVLIGAASNEIVFTGSATESNNLALKGAAEALAGKGRHILTTAIEHKSVLDPLKRLSMKGFDVTHAPVTPEGFLNLDAFEKCLRPDTILISVMLVNNEIGTIQPVEAVSRIAKKRGIALHCDASQAVGKIPVDVQSLGVDFLSFTAHKFHGPKGVGALYIRKSDPRPVLVPQLDGGGQEGGFRSGTLNVPGIVGLGKACEIAAKRMKKDTSASARLRARLLKGLQAKIPGIAVNGDLVNRLPYNLNLSIEGVTAADLLARLPNLAISAGSACLSSSPEPSYVLKALGISESQRRSSIRFGLHRFTTPADIDSAINQIHKAIL